MDRYQVHDYADLAKPKFQHEAVKRDFGEFKKDMIAEGLPDFMIREWKNWIANWWMIHINIVDKGGWGILSGR